jgi:SAM-dependent methyltransferase
MHFIATEREEWDLESFLESGRKTIAELREAVGAEVGFGGEVALDLGCGVGRISFALAEHFDRVIGIDVSEGMIADANRLKNVLGLTSMEFISNDGQDLSMIHSRSCDLVFSYIMFQHIPNRKVILEYIDQMARVVRPLGHVLFQVPVYWNGPWMAVWRFVQASFRFFLWPLETLHLVPPEKGVAFRGSRLQKDELDRALRQGGLTTVGYVRGKSTYRFCDDVVVYCQRDAAD